MAPNYTNLIRMLYSINLYCPVKLGLENMVRLNALIGDPLFGRKIVHVTGTNGKGSVATKVSQGLQALGLKTGLFTSPHISSFRERIQVNGELMSTQDVEDMLPMLFELCQRHQVPATFFELTTALAFLKFQHAQCDAVVLEVGLGGRLDATNIVHPLLSIITSVQLDHTKILGDTVQAIAVEKAGIIKPSVDVIVGPDCPMQVIREVALSRGAPLHTVEGILTEDERSFRSAALSDTDDLNTDISKAALKLLLGKGLLTCSGTVDSTLTSDAMRSALRARPICRFEQFMITVQTSSGQRSQRVIMDIAHNADAMRALVRRVKQRGLQRVRLVIGMSADKDVKTCVSIAKEMVDDVNRVHCTEARHPRAIAHGELRQMFHTEHAPAGPGDSKDVTQALHNAIKAALRINDGELLIVSHSAAEGVAIAADEEGEVIIVCGTAFIMAQARSAIGLVEAKDSDDLQSTFSSGTSLADSVTKYGDAQEHFESSKPLI